MHRLLNSIYFKMVQFTLKSLSFLQSIHVLERDLISASVAGIAHFLVCAFVLL